MKDHQLNLLALLDLIRARLAGKKNGATVARGGKDRTNSFGLAQSRMKDGGETNDTHVGPYNIMQR